MFVSFEQALRSLSKGELVILPTETVYGLAGRMDSEKAIENIFKIKKRPKSDPLILHCFDVNQVSKLVKNMPAVAKDLFSNFSPGPLTLILEKSSQVSSLITANQDFAAFRIPRQQLLRKLLKDLDMPLAAPSANFFGCLSPTTAEAAYEALGKKVPVLDGGDCEEGIESTILKIEQDQISILRPGTISKEDLQGFLKSKKYPHKVTTKEETFIPGSLASHYKPSCPFYIIEDQKQAKEFLSKKFPDKVIYELQLDPVARQAAQQLYSQLRALSKDERACIFVKREKNQKGEIWQAIWNRLEKACTGKF